MHERDKIRAAAIRRLAQLLCDELNAAELDGLIVNVVINVVPADVGKLAGKRWTCSTNICRKISL